MFKRGDFTIVHLYPNGSLQVDGRLYDWKKFVRFIDRQEPRPAWLELRGNTYGVEWTSEDALRWPTLYSRLDVLLYRMSLMNAPMLQIRVWYDPFSDVPTEGPVIETITSHIKRNEQILTGSEPMDINNPRFIESEDIFSIVPKNGSKD